MKMKYEIFVSFAFLIGSISATLRPRVIGGGKAEIKKFPYMASIRARGIHICGACIISSRHILTAAHCVTDHINAWPSNEVTINTGTTSSTQTGNSHRFSQLTIHPEWKGVKEKSGNNDVAVITLADEIRFDDNQQKIDLATSEIVSHTPATLTGWGSNTDKNPIPSAQLHELAVKVLTNKDCQKYHPLEIFKEQMCTYAGAGHGCCYGDSGSPLVINNKVVGVASWVNDGFFGAGSAELFTNVYAQRSFITSAMQ